ncbi:MAG: RNA polymerase sigma factor [Blautia sp.]
MYENYLQPAKNTREEDPFVDVLIRKARKQDPDAFCQLMDLHMQSMYKVAKAYLKNEEDVADAIQETILTCYEKLQTLKQNRYFKTWLTRILINKCKDILASQKKIQPMEALPEKGKHCTGYADVEWCVLLEPLDEKYRTVLLLYYMEGFTIREIAHILDMKEPTVKSRLQRGRSYLAAAYHSPKEETI